MQKRFLLLLLMVALSTVAFAQSKKHRKKPKPHALSKTVFMAERGEEDRSSSAPYLSGDTFRAHADFIFDETKIPFSPEEVEPGNSIFVKGDYLAAFFSEVHPLISSPYILIAHNSDESVPGPFASFLDDDKLIAWFGQNVENYNHPKLHPIPIGIANRYWAHGDTKVFELVKAVFKGHPKERLLYMNFSVVPSYQESAYQERLAVYKQFVAQPFCSVALPKDLHSYLCDLSVTKFVLSPRGNGLDCHRTWEALYMGAIPIVGTSTLDPMYEGLPVVIVKDWSEVTESFLEQTFKEMQEQTYQWEKLDAAYWIEQIRHLGESSSVREKEL